MINLWEIKNVYPYAQGKQNGFSGFREISDEEFNILKLEALRKANNILERI